MLSAHRTPSATARVCHVAREMAHVYTYGAMTVPQVKTSQCILVWGKNDLHTNPQTADAILYARQQGAKLIVVYPIRMLVVQSGNPAVTMTDSKRVQAALEKLEFLVVLDPFLTRTAKLAPVVLPASICFDKTQLNRASLRNNLVSLQNQVIDWLGDSWQSFDHWVYRWHIKLKENDHDKEKLQEWQARRSTGFHAD